jgi:hypothetical protein
VHGIPYHRVLVVATSGWRGRAGTIA